MGDKPTDEPQQRSEETAKLELPSLRLPGLRRGRKRRAPEPADEPVGAAPAEATAFEAKPVEAHPVPAEAPGQRRAERKRPSLPALPGWVAALVTGLAVGASGAGLTWLSLRGCEAVKGTESCGGPGLFLLVVIVVLMVLLGGLLLALLRVPEPRSTSFLGVGVLVVVVLVTLIQQLFSGWMFLVVPLLGAASYVLALRITTTFVEPTPERGPEHDVR